MLQLFLKIFFCGLCLDVGSSPRRGVTHAVQLTPYKRGSAQCGVGDAHAKKHLGEMRLTSVIQSRP